METPHINRHNQSSVLLTYKQSPKIDMQDASGSVNPLTSRDNHSQAQQSGDQNETPGTSTATGLPEVADLISQMTVNDNPSQHHGSHAIQNSSSSHEASSGPSGQSSQTDDLESDYSVGLQIHAQEVAQPPEDPLVSSLQENTDLMKNISLMLNPYNQVIRNWEGLAYELHAPPNIIAQCKRSTHHSQTRMLFEVLSTSETTQDLKVNQLIDTLSSLHRKDVVALLQKNIPENRRGNKVNLEVTSNDELMEKLETLLDKDSRVIKNWYHLGKKLGLSKEVLQGIKDGDRPHGLPELFEYIYTKYPMLSVAEFKAKMNKINRKDIVETLEDFSPGLMKDRIPLDSDEMKTLCYLLGQNCCDTVKDWKHLAIELKIDYNTYKSFDKKIPESPTHILIDWALIEKPGMTVKDLCGHFKNMKRYDVIEGIEKYYGRSFLQS